MAYDDDPSGFDQPRWRQSGRMRAGAVSDLRKGNNHLRGWLRAKEHERVKNRIP